MAYSKSVSTYGRSSERKLDQHRLSNIKSRFIASD